MTAAHPTAHPATLQLGITVTPAVVRLVDGATLTVTDRVPLTAPSRRQAALSGQLYFFGGRIDRPDGYLGGYLGQSGDLNGPRPATSLTRWVVTQRRILPAGMAILRRDAPYDDRYRRFIEARAIMSLSAGMLWLLNTHTSAGTASANLSHTQVIQGQALATDIADVIRANLFGGQVNPHPSPAANAREVAVRCVGHADRAVDVYDVLRAMRAAGFRSTGLTVDMTVRRDLLFREGSTRGRPRVFTCTHRGRRVFWHPGLTKAQALRGYDLAHP